MLIIEMKSGHYYIPIAPPQVPVLCLPAVVGAFLFPALSRNIQEGCLRQLVELFWVMERARMLC